MKPVSLLCPPSVAAERIYDTLCDGRESITVTTAAGERIRAFRDGRGVTVFVRRAVVYLASPREAARYLAAVPTEDERATLAALLESVVGL